MAVPRNEVSIAGKRLAALMVTAAHCVLDPAEELGLTTVGIEPCGHFEAVEVAWVDQGNTVETDPVTGCEARFPHLVAVLAAFGQPRQSATCYWQSDIPAIFQGKLIGYPEFDPPHLLYPCFRYTPFRLRSALSNHLLEKVYCSFQSNTPSVGKGIAVHSGSLVAVYISAATGMCGGPVVIETHGVQRVAGLLVCGPLHPAYTAMLATVVAVQANDLQSAEASLKQMETSAFGPESVHQQTTEHGEFQESIGKIRLRLGKKSVALRRLNALAPWLATLGDSCSRAYNLAVSVHSPSFSSALTVAHQAAAHAGHFKSFSELLNSAP